MSSICVIIMAKNEAHCIVDTLNSTLQVSNVREYIVCDTGSTDDTIDVCKKFFVTNNVKGTVYQHEWKNFEYNYTVLLKLGHDYATSDYLWLIDADDVLSGSLTFPTNACFDAYRLKYGKTFVYERPQIFKKSLRFAHHGVLHGYNARDDESPYTNVLIQGDYFIDSRRLGNRHKNMTKEERYLQDAATIENALKDKPNNARYVFYLAQSYHDAGHYQKSIDNYQKRVSMGQWEELSDPYAISPNFVVDVHGDYIITLVVTDILGAASQPVSMTVSFSNMKPVAVPGGNQAVVEGDTV